MSKGLILSAIIAASSAYCAYNPKPITPVIQEMLEDGSGQTRWDESGTRGMALGLTALFSIPLIARSSYRREENE